MGTRALLLALILGFGVAAAEEAATLLAPVRLRAGDEVIDTGKYIAHSGPLYADYDADGVPDLLVGNFQGHIQLFRNAGTAQKPQFEDKGLLEVDGKPVRIKNW